MSDANISLDVDAAAATAQEWLDYAEKVEEQGRTPHVPIEELRAALGDVYEPYLAAKKNEYAQREAAYGRVAEQARHHAAKLMNTRAHLRNADDENAAQISSVIES